MTKKDIVKAISEEIGLPQQKTGEIVQKTFDAIIEALALEGRVELRNFGVFEVKQRAARNARNPRTGEKIPIPSKLTVAFRPGKEMELRVQSRAPLLKKLPHTPPPLERRFLLNPPNGTVTKTQTPHRKIKPSINIWQRNG